MKSTNVIKSWRAKKGYTQEEAAELFDFSRITYMKYENNPLSINLELLIKMTKLLNGNLQEIFFALEQDYLS